MSLRHGLHDLRHRWFIWINYKPHWWQRRTRNERTGDST